MAEPEDTPVTSPDALIVAIVAELEDHVPPVTVDVSAVVLAGQIVDVPEIVPAVRAVVTVTALVATAVPQPVVTVYEMVVVPADAPNTVPLAFTVAMAVLALLHTPPVTVLVNAEEPATQIVAAPDSVPADVAALTVIVRVAVPVPQALVLE